MNDDVVHIEPIITTSLRVGDKLFRSAFDFKLTEKELEKAARELGETEEKKKVCLSKLKEKLSNEPNIKYRLDDSYLLRFLRVRKYDVKKAYQNVKMFYEERKKHPDFFCITSKLKSLLELNWLRILPYADEEGIVMFWLNIDRWNPEEKTFEEILQAGSALCDIVTVNPGCQINGVLGIWNLSGITARHVKEFLQKGRLWALVSIQQNGYPWRIRKVIILNTNRYVRLLFNLVRPLLQKKVADRIILLGSDLKELHKHVNPVLLPKSLMGNLEETECDSSQHVLNNIPYLKYERTFIFD